MLGREVGSYRILEKIGQGGMGVVYRGVHTKLEQEVAIKVLSPQFSQDPSMRERFVKEAKIQAKFSHPNVVNVLNYIEDEGNTFLIMEYVNGEGLEARLKREGKLPVEKALSISFSVLKALDFMHSKGIIHRDVKPSNIMFTGSGVVKVTDFGIAKVMGERGQTRTEMIGTFQYMSPEQILGEETSVASDIYSFGVTLYEMVTGRVPFSGDSEYKTMKGHLEEKPLPPWEINTSISKRLGRVILRTLSKDPKDRYQNVKKLRDDLKGATKKPKGIETFLQIINTASWRNPTLNLDKRRFLLLGLGIVLLVPIFWAVRKQNDFISVTPVISKPDTDSSETYKLNRDSEFSLPGNKNPGGLSREASQSDKKDTEIETTEWVNKETTEGETTPAGADTKKGEPRERVLTNPALSEERENGQVEEERSVVGVPLKKEGEYFLKPKIQRRGKWRIRK